MLTTGRIDSVEVRTLAGPPDVLLLSLVADGPFSFEAGQYLEVLHPDGTAIPLSIASPPERLPRLCLHYRSTPGAPEAVRMDALLGSGGPLRLQGPGGDVRLPADDDRPLLLVAGGTGISQALCLATAQRRRHPATPVVLLACADEPADFYFEDLIPDGTTRELIADPRRDASNRGLARLAERATGIDPQSRIVLSGGPAFVWAATDVLTGSGIPAERLESDVYAWAPRPG